MSIQTAIENAQQKVENAYTAVQNKGGTMPSTQNLSNLPTAINSISTAGTVEELNVTPTTSAQTITPSAGVDGFNPVKVAAVTSAIDSDIQPANIKKNVNILGVTGTLEEGITPTGTISITENGQFDVANYATANVNVSGGGGSGEGRYLVQVIDYDGTVLKSEKLDTGDTFTLPSNPSHSGLVFQSWSSPVTITNNTVTVTNSDITIGATYTTASGLSEFDITLTAVTGLSVTLNMNGTKNWGDGTSDTSTTHTYSSEGNYTITCDGTTMATSSSSGIMGQSSSNYARYILTSARMANVTSIGGYAFFFCCSLTSITIPSGVTSIGADAFYSCYSLTSITIPSGVTSISDYAFQNCYSLTSITIPSGVTSIGQYMFYSCYSLTSITIPSGVTRIGPRAFYFCSSLTSITIPSGVTSIGQYMFSSCSSLTSITIPSGVTSISDYAFNGCHSLTSITIPSGVTSIKDNTFNNCYSLTSAKIPSSVTSIRDYAFFRNYSNIEYDFSNHTSVPTLSATNAFTDINGICKIKVPASLEASWKAATNWSTYANYIVGV